MSLQTSPATPAPIATLRMLAGGLISGVVLFGIVLFVVLDSTAYPPVWVAAGLGALTVVAHLAAETVGYRVPALSPAEPAEATRAAGRAAYQSSLLLRFALCEAVAIIAVAAAFAVEPATADTYLVGGTLSLALLLWHVWPSDRTIRRIEAGLDRDGARSDLHATLHGQPAGSALR